MKTYPKDSAYVETQLACNYAHSNGEMETAGDWNAAYMISDRLQEAELEPERILVLGCRTGYECCVLASDFDADVVGIDIVHEFAKRAAERQPALVADMHDLPLPNKRFDLTVTIGTLEHCYNPQRALNEMSRVTDGHVFFTADLEEDRGPFGSHYAFSSDPQQWLMMANISGLKVVDYTIEQGSCHNGIHALTRT